MSQGLFLVQPTFYPWRTRIRQLESPSAFPKAFPLDIWNEIIFWLRDRRTLQACMLVCRQMRSLCLRPLYSMTAVCTPEDLCDCWRRVPIPTDEPGEPVHLRLYDPLAKFVDLITTNPAIARVIEQLTIVLSCHCSNRPTTHAFLSLLHRLPSLKSLSLRGIIIETDPAGLAGILSTVTKLGPKNLESLEIDVDGLDFRVDLPDPTADAEWEFSPLMQLDEAQRLMALFGEVDDFMLSGQFTPMYWTSQAGFKAAQCDADDAQGDDRDMRHSHQRAALESHLKVSHLDMSDFEHFMDDLFFPDFVAGIVGPRTKAVTIGKFSKYDDETIATVLESGGDLHNIIAVPTFADIVGKSVASSVEHVRLPSSQWPHRTKMPLLPEGNNIKMLTLCDVKLDLPSLLNLTQLITEVLLEAGPTLRTPEISLNLEFSANSRSDPGSCLWSLAEQAQLDAVLCSIRDFLAAKRFRKVYFDVEIARYLVRGGLRDRWIVRFEDSVKGWAEMGVPVQVSESFA